MGMFNELLAVDWLLNFSDPIIWKMWTFIKPPLVCFMFILSLIKMFHWSLIKMFHWTSLSFPVWSLGVISFLSFIISFKMPPGVALLLVHSYLCYILICSLIRCWDATSFHEIYRITAGLGGGGSGPELCVWSLLYLRY